MDLACHSSTRTKSERAPSRQRIFVGGGPLSEKRDSAGATQPGLGSHWRAGWLVLGGYSELRPTPGEFVDVGMDPYSSVR